MKTPEGISEEVFNKMITEIPWEVMVSGDESTGESETSTPRGYETKEQGRSRYSESSNDESIMIIDEISSEAPKKKKIRITQPLLDREAQKEAPAETPTKVPTEVPNEQTKAGNRLPVGNTEKKATVDNKVRIRPEINTSSDINPKKRKLNNHASGNVVKSKTETSQEANKNNDVLETPVCEATSPDIGIFETTIWPDTVKKLKFAHSDEIPGPHRFAEIMNIDEKLEYFIVDERCQHYRLRESHFLEIISEVEESQDIPNISSFINFLNSLTPSELRKILSKKNMNFLAMFYRHEENENGLNYDSREKMSPLRFAVMNSGAKVIFLRQFGDPRVFRTDVEIEIINVSMTEMIFNGDKEFFNTLIDFFPEIFLKTSDDELFMNMFKKASLFSGNAMNAFVERCENYHAAGNSITKNWERKNYSVRVRENRSNQIRRSPIKFLTCVLSYYA